MTDFSPAEVLLVPFPFTDLSRSKPRPALVISGAIACERLPDLIVCQITSKAERYHSPGLGDIPLRDWQSAGLPMESTVRLCKVATLAKGMIFRKLGKISPSDWARVQSAKRDIWAI